MTGFAARVRKVYISHEYIGMVGEQSISHTHVSLLKFNVNMLDDQYAHLPMLIAPLAAFHCLAWCRRRQWAC